jgi:RHS repeat-associated protein
MSSQFHSAERGRPTRGNVATQLSFLLFLALVSPLHAQVGDNSPGGHSGIFNGQIHTGCSYDPYTGNATRSITDIAVAGAVGEYPLALVRTANSRNPSTTEVFAWAGGWNHNYNWILEDSASTTTQNFPPAAYTVDFPDGRVETFKSVTWDTACYRVRVGANGSAGVRERLVPIAPPNNMYAYMILPDGGKVEFLAEQHNASGHYYYKYHVTAIIDPHGLRTTIATELVANGTRRRITTVTEPAGRQLQFFYTTNNGPKIDHINGMNGNSGRTVQYSYIYCNGCRLDHVVYYGNANWTAHYQYCNSNIGQGLPPLLLTADDPMYAGPMKRIAYEYKPATPNNPDRTRPVYGQILRERYWDGTAGHEASGPILSQLTVGMPNSNPSYRTETRADGATRTFVYGGPYVTWVSDFMGHQSTQAYDSYKYINSVIDFNRNETNYTCDPITGNVTQVKYPLTQGDTPGQGQRPTVNYIYTNNYYLYSLQDEGNHVTTITRDGNNRATRIDYPDGGYETFGYDASHFYQLNSHRMATAGVESFTYNGRASLRDTYRSPDNPSGNPTASYQYDSRDRVSGVTDVLGHTTSFNYNDRGQLTVTTLPPDPVDGQRHTIKNYYNPDGTSYAKENELHQATNYTYDDYRRLKTVTPPVRGFGDTNTNTTTLSYYVNGVLDDYSHTDSNVCWVHLPSGKWINTVYDDNRRKTSATVGWNTPDAAMTSYGYDAMGNMTSVTNPLNHNNVVTAYDERNRPSSITVGGQATNFTYDTAGRKKTITRANTQVITNVSFDTMNRVLLQSATNISQGNNYNMVTQYEYYAPGEGQPVGFLKTFRDPDLYGTNDKYSYAYDTLGRKSTVTYPAEPVTGVHRTEVFSYDTAGRLATYQNRAVKTQTFHYDALNRVTYFTWNDGLTPRVDFGYDAASRLTSINNANATISRGYFYDNLLWTETETITGGRAKTVSYTYDADGNRASTQYPAPENYIFSYTYTGRNQLKKVNDWATYDYDPRGNLITRTLDANSTYSDYLYDTHDRVTRIRNFLSGTTRTVNYGYDDLSNDRLWAKRLSSPTTPESSKGEVFRYDLADQTTIAQLDVLNPDQVHPPSTPQTVVYDPNGNRTWFTNIPYVTDNLSQYTSIGGSPLTYRADANLATYNGSTYNYDARNRLTSVSGPASASFKYDGLNRQVSRTDSQGTTYNVWDGWNLVEEYQGATTTAAYVYGATGLIAGALNGQLYYFYQDGSGSTSHLADSNGVLKEWYRYDLQGNPFFYNGNDQQINNSAFGVRHLFTGQQWYSEVGLYDLRNRFYSPDIGRFLQPDPIGHRGGSNLYRYCRNNPVTKWDPSGLQVSINADPGGVPTADRVWVPGDPVPGDISRTGFLPGDFGWGGIPFDLEPLLPDSLFRSSREVAGAQLHAPESPSVEHPPPSSVPPQNPSQPSIDPLNATTTAEFIAIGNMIEHGNTMDTTPVFDPISLASGAVAGRAALTVVTQVAATRAMWVGKDGLAAAQASGASLLKPSQAALNAMRTGDMSLMQAESAAWARGATGQVPVFFGDGAGRTFLNHELPELLKNMDSGKVTEIDISF